MKPRYLAPWIFSGALLLSGCKPEIQAPTANQLFVRATEPVAITFELTHRKDAKLEFQFTRSNLQIPGQSPKPEQPATVLPSPISTTKRSPRRTAVIFAIDQAGTWRVRARNQGQGEQWSNWRQFAVIDDDQSPVGASLSLAPSDYRGPCPIAIKATGLIGSVTPTRLRYWFQRSDGHETPPIELDLTVAGTLVAKTDMPAVGERASSSEAGWLQLVVQPLPEGTWASSPQVPYQVVCTNRRQD